jgi:hypothetical protein
MLVKVTFPPGVQGITPRQSPRQSSGGGGNPATILPDANGQATVDTSQVTLLDLLQHGFTVAPLVGTTAQRPTSGTYPGQPYLDTTLNKPIWRNGANTGWIDASGTAV